MQKHRLLAVQPLSLVRGPRESRGATESRMVACVVQKLPLFKDSCYSPCKSNDDCERFESTVVDGDGLNLHLQQI